MHSAPGVVGCLLLTLVVSGLAGDPAALGVQPSWWSSWWPSSTSSAHARSGNAPAPDSSDSTSSTVFTDSSTDSSSDGGSSGTASPATASNSNATLTYNNTNRSPTARVHNNADAQCGLSLLSRRRPRKSRSLWSPTIWTQSQGRIVNGKESRQGQWPWQASLQVLHPRLGFIGHWCGGVLVRDRWVVTAAHCIHNDVFSLPLPALWTAVLGDWDRDVEEHTEVRVPVEKIIIHELFHSYNNDIALMKLSRRVRIAGDSRVRSLCLPPAPYNNASAPADAPAAPNAPGERSPLCMVSGWGRQSSNGDETSTLLQASVPLHPNSLCAKRYGGPIRIGAGHLCAGHLDGSSGTCVGDSGGPLQCLGADGRWFLVGITSFGSGCARPGFPDVYTRMAHYSAWIQEKMLKDDDADEEAEAEEEDPEDEDQDLADY